MTTARPSHWSDLRVKMVRCVNPEPQPPTEPAELEVWCEYGLSGRPIQTHVGNEGTVLWVNEDGGVCVEFDDGDQRLLYAEELERQPSFYIVASDTTRLE